VARLEASYSLDLLELHSVTEIMFLIKSEVNETSLRPYSVARFGVSDVNPRELLPNTA